MAESSRWRIAMQHNLRDTMALLARTPAVLVALLWDLPETWTRRNEGEATWSAFDIIGHLMHSERTDWMPRAKMILQFGGTTTLDTFHPPTPQPDNKGKVAAQHVD